MNLVERASERYVVSGGHRNRVGVLADALCVACDDDNIIGAMDIIIFARAQSTCVNIQIDNRSSQKALVKRQTISNGVFDINLSQIEDN